jgi:aryl-alcohol dehydrogenase (NADP+)
VERVNLGAAGIKVSRVGLGTMGYGLSSWRPWVLGEKDARPLIERALELGINFFDTADVYSLGESEAILGRALRDLGPGRDRVVIATKVFGQMGEDPNQGGLSRKHIMHAIDNSLRRLGTDYVDLYQIHRFDSTVPIEETLEALTDVVHAGKALHIGASTLTAWQLARYVNASDRCGLGRFVTMQNHYNLVYRDHERELFPFCLEEGIGVIPWSPLARGFVCGNRRPGGGGSTLRARTDDRAHHFYYRESDFAVVDRLADVAKARGMSHAQIALAWLRHQPWVTAINIGATRREHLEQAAAAVDIDLTEEEIRNLEEPYMPHAAEPI